MRDPGDVPVRAGVRAAGGAGGEGAERVEGLAAAARFSSRGSWKERWRRGLEFCFDVHLFDLREPLLAYFVLTFAQMMREGIGAGEGGAAAGGGAEAAGGGRAG